VSHCLQDFRHVHRPKAGLIGASTNSSVSTHSLRDVDRSVRLATSNNTVSDDDDDDHDDEGKDEREYGDDR